MAALTLPQLELAAKVYSVLLISIVGLFVVKKKNLTKKLKKKPICNYGLVTHLCFLFIAENWQEKLACMGRTQEYLIVFSIKINQFAEKLGWKVQDAVHNSCGVQYIWEFDPSFFFLFFFNYFLTRFRRCLSGIFVQLWLLKEVLLYHLSLCIHTCTLLIPYHHISSAQKNSN